MTKHIAIYVRVSSKSQDLRSQIPDLTHWAAGQSAPVVWYRDKASGKSMDRAGWQRLQSALDAGKVSKIVCWRLDRLGRTAKGLTALFEDLVSRGIGLFSLKDSLDLSTPAGRLLANVLASVAVYEAEVRQERQTAGIAAAKAAGKRWGGSKRGRLLRVTEEQREQVLSMRSKPITHVARATGLSRPTVYRLLAYAAEQAAKK